MELKLNLTNLEGSHFEPTQIANAEPTAPPAEPTEEEGSVVAEQPLDLGIATTSLNILDPLAEILLPPLEELATKQARWKNEDDQRNLASEARLALRRSDERRSHQLRAAKDTDQG